MRERILKFLAALDAALVTKAAGGQRLDLHVIGKAAVILFYGGEQSGATTSDVDVVQVSHPPAPLLSAALEQFGEGTAGAKEHGLYLQSVLDGIPPLAGDFRSRCTKAPGDWKVLTVWQVDANDLAASKLKRYAAKDRADLQHLCDKGFLQVEKLRQSLEGAFIWETEESGDPDRQRAFANLAKVIDYIEGNSRGL